MRLNALTISVKANCFDEPPVSPEARHSMTCEARLVEQAIAGDREAFRQLIEMHELRVARLARRLTGYRGEVDDLVQDVFVLVLEHLKRFRSESNFSTWLTKLTISRSRRERLRRIVRLKFLQRRRHAVEEEARESTTDNAETHEQIRNAVASLPQKLREVIVLRYLEELDVDEICSMLSISRSAFDVRLHRGREKLREMLEI
jgi:RNA polymerase sigma-70 factor (ECF subfamily)